MAAAVTGSKSGFSPASVAVAASGTVTCMMTDEKHGVAWARATAGTTHDACTQYHGRPNA